MSISLRQLRYFLEIVDSHGFSAAADKLCVAQSALSRQLKELEDEVGAPLLQRTSRQLHLTAAGETFYAGAQATLASLDATLRDTRQVAAGGAGVLRLLHSSSVPLLGRLMHGIASQLAARPALSIEVTQTSSEQQLASIEGGEADLGLVRLPLLRSLPDVILTPLFTEPLLVALPAGHALSANAELSLAALREQRFVSVPHRERGGLSRRVADLCVAAGFFPQAAAITSRKLSQLGLVQAACGIAVVPASLAEMAPAGIVLRPLRDADSQVGLLRRRDAPAHVQSFAEALRQTLAG